MELIQAAEQELDELITFYQHVADYIGDQGFRNWHWGRSPGREALLQDIRAQKLYIMREDGAIAAAVAIHRGQDPAYDDYLWTCGIRPGSFSRLAVHPSMQGAGLGGIVLDDVLQILRRSGCDCVRCDAAAANRNAISLYEKMGFRRCGDMQWADSEADSIRFDKPLMRETPLWPIPMVPAFRDGEATPWGGSALREEYGKQARNDITGESMEVSSIPGLESRDLQGRTLTELIREFGEKLVGAYADKPFPLLLKLIDAHQQLSVQVHPGNGYAVAREKGQAGKNEAWLVLDTPPGGGELVYGVKPGTTIQALREACETGTGVEVLLNRVRVSPGDVLYIPAGCVHSVGEGIVLYEIQESSDLTYRFYDWNRTDANGKKRELHLDRALDVTDIRLAPVPVRVEKAFGVRRVLNEESFTLDIIRTDSVEMLPPVNEFGILTVTEGEPMLRFSGAFIRMKKGDTCLLPRNSPALALVGNGAAALAMPV